MSIHLLPSLLMDYNVALPNMKRTPIFLGIVILIFAGLAYIFAWSSLLTVKTISISGAPTSESESIILQKVDIKSGSQLARVEPRAIERRISAIAWVDKSTVSRDWIRGKVTIHLTPRTPMAFYNGKTLDKSGKVFELPGFAKTNLPEVTAANPQLGLAAIDLFRNLPSEIQSSVLSLAAKNESSFILSIERNGRKLQLLWGKNEMSELKLQVIDSLLALPENKKIRSIDVSAPHAPIVK